MNATAPSSTNNERSSAETSSLIFTETTTAGGSGVLVVDRRDSDDSSMGSTRNAFTPATNITFHPILKSLPPSGSSQRNDILKTIPNHQERPKKKKNISLPSSLFSKQKAVPFNDDEEIDNANPFIRPPALTSLEYGVSVGEEEWYFQQQHTQGEKSNRKDEDDEDFICPPPGLQEQPSSHLFGMTFIKDANATSTDNYYQNYHPFSYSTTPQHQYGQQDGYDEGILAPPRPVRPDPPGHRSSLPGSPCIALVPQDSDDDNAALFPITLGDRDDLAAKTNFMTPVSEASSSPLSHDYNSFNASRVSPICPSPQHQPVHRHYSIRWRDRAPDSFIEFSGNSHKKKTFLQKIWHKLDPNIWLVWDLEQERRQSLNKNDTSTNNDSYRKSQYGNNEWSILRFLRFLLYNPLVPEFTSVQQFSWSTILGITIGVYTAVWKVIIEYSVDTMWKTLPEAMFHWGVFTELDGSFPLPHYMWICPSICGGILSYIFAWLSPGIPDQNDWIRTCHARGVIDHKSFWLLFFLSTAGMASGLSLGPELPLVLTAGMIGSWLGVVTRQSVLSARAMNLTAASAAIAGFFGFPMAGALFVLEIPHRMGLQYFEALSPATFASIIAVIVNRMVLKNDVTGYYDYPFLTTVLPAHIFYIAVFYGLVGSIIGAIYTVGVKKLKTDVHLWFHNSGCDHLTGDDESMTPPTTTVIIDSDPTEHAGERRALLIRDNDMMYQHRRTSKVNVGHNLVRKKCFFLRIRNKPLRAAAAGTIAGFLTGATCMFVPHVLFWGEAQLQTLIDKGKTPLPIFGQGDEVTSDLTAYGYCLIDPHDKKAIAAGFSPACAVVIALSKVFVVGLSLGTGIIGGHFWGPLFVGVAASYFVLSLCETLSGTYGIGDKLSAYPTVAVLCIMGSTHVVTFRAHIAIMLILTLTIRAFTEEGRGTQVYTAGDYSAVFPLLVVSCFVSLMATRGIVFYKTQRCRGDILAMAEALCEPGKAGQPLVVGYDDAIGSICSEEQSENDAPTDENNQVSEFLSVSSENDKDDSTVSSAENEDPTATAPEDNLIKDVHAEGEHDDSLSPSSPPSLPNQQDFCSVPTSPTDLTTWSSGISSQPLPPSGHKRSTFHHRRINTVSDYGSILSDTINSSNATSIERTNVGTTASSFLSINTTHSRSKSDTIMTSIHMDDGGLGIAMGTKTASNMTHSRSKIGENMTSIGMDDGGISGAIDVTTTSSMTHCRTKSGESTTSIGSGGGNRSRANSTTSSTHSRSTAPSGFKRITSFGEISDFQPSLFTQARLRSSSSATAAGCRSNSSISTGRGGNLRDIMSHYKNKGSSNITSDHDDVTSDAGSYTMLSQSCPWGLSSDGRSSKNHQRPRSFSLENPMELRREMANNKMKENSHHSRVSSA